VHVRRRQLRGLAAGEAPISRRIATRMLQEFRRGRSGRGQRIVVDQLVAEATSAHESQLRRRGPQLRSEAAHVHLQRAEHAIVHAPPAARGQVLSDQHCVRPAGKRHKQLKFGGRQREQLAADRRYAAACVDP
jgi:hypothetical protein